MRFMVMVRATRHSEAGEMPDTDLLAAMGRFNEELVAAGVMLSGEGLHPSERGARVRFGAGDDAPQVVHGPFPVRELVAGFWLWRCASMDEAIDWARRCPRPMPGECEIEVRRVFEAEDFGEALTPELRAQEDRLRQATEGGAAAR